MGEFSTIAYYGIGAVMSWLFGRDNLGGDVISHAWLQGVFPRDNRSFGARGDQRLLPIQSIPSVIAQSILYDGHSSKVLSQGHGKIPKLYNAFDQPKG